MLRRMLIAATLVALAAPGVANAQNPILRATVGPEAVITMTDAAGTPLTNIPVGTYDIVVSDRSVDHNFHLSGPSVNRATTVLGMESLTWTVDARKRRLPIRVRPARRRRCSARSPSARA